MNISTKIIEATDSIVDSVSQVESVYQAMKQKTESNQVLNKKTDEYYEEDNTNKFRK